MKLDILAFGAHPDDVELCSGGTILRHVDQGYSVGIVDLTRGELGTRGTPEIRRREAQKAAEILGVKVRENLGFQDGFFKNDREHQLAVIKMIRKYRPEIILANALHDRHPDHGRAGALLEEASFKAGLVKIETRENNKRQERWRPNCVFHYTQFRNVTPDLLVDITAYMDKRMEATRAHKSQFHNPDSGEPETVLTDPEFFDFIYARARELGRSIGVQYAEAFHTNQRFGVGDFVELDTYN